MASASWLRRSPCRACDTRRFGTPIAPRLSSGAAGRGRTIAPRLFLLDGGRRASLARLGSAVDPERPEDLQAWIEEGLVVLVRTVLKRFTADDAQARAIRAADRRNRLAELDRLTDHRLELDLVVVGQPDDLGFDRGVERLARHEVDRRQSLFAEGHRQRKLDRPEAAAASQGKGRLRQARDEQAAARPAEAHPASDGGRGVQIVAPIEPDPVEREIT